MNNKITLILLLLIITLLLGCERSSQPFLEYQSGEFEAKATLDLQDEKYSILIKKQLPATYLIEFLSPDTMKGITVEKSEEGVFYSVGSLRLPLETEAGLVTKALKLFELKENEMISASTELINGVKINKALFSTEYGEITLLLSTESGLPLRFEADIDGMPLILSISDFKTVQNQTQ